MKKKIFAIVMAAMMVITCFALTGCGSSEETSMTTTEGKIVVGLDDTFAPMGFRDGDGNLIGFDIDLATAVAEKMGYEVEFKPIDWDAKEMELEAGTIDCIWNGMSVTPERQENMQLTNKYLNNKIVVMTLADSDVTVKEAADLNDLKIATQVDSSALEMLQANEEYENKDKTNRIDLHVEIAEMMGSEIYLYGELDGEKVIANVPSNKRIQNNSDVALYLDTNRVHIFDKETEELICD